MWKNQNVFKFDLINQQVEVELLIKNYKPTLRPRIRVACILTYIL